MVSKYWQYACLGCYYKPCDYHYFSTISHSQPRQKLKEKRLETCTYLDIIGYEDLVYCAIIYFSWALNIVVFFKKSYYLVYLKKKRASNDFWDAKAIYPISCQSFCTTFFSTWDQEAIFDNLVKTLTVKKQGTKRGIYNFTYCRVTSTLGENCMIFNEIG